MNNIRRLATFQKEEKKSTLDKVRNTANIAWNTGSAAGLGFAAPGLIARKSRTVDSFLTGISSKRAYDRLAQRRNMRGNKIGARIARARGQINDKIAKAGNIVMGTYAKTPFGKTLQEQAKSFRGGSLNKNLAAQTALGAAAGATYLGYKGAQAIKNRKIRSDKSKKQNRY